MEVEMGTGTGGGWKGKGEDRKDDQKEPYNTGISGRKAMRVDRKSCPPAFR